MYLWCANCCHARLRERWEVKGAKYGVCPSCGCSEYRSAVEWSIVASINGYATHPEKNVSYPLHPVLF